MEKFGKRHELETYNDECQTGHLCPKSGIWVCKDHTYVEIVLSEGKIFPNCQKEAGHRATWWFRVT